MLFLPCAFAGLALALPQGPEDPEDPGLALAPSPKLAPHPAHLQGPQVHPLQGLKGKVLCFILLFFYQDYKVLIFCLLDKG